jgi:hypothetical protein
MSSDAVIDKKSEQTATQNESLNDSSVLADAQYLGYELLGLMLDHLQLAALETQRAGVSLVTMIIAGLMIAGLFTSAWLGLMAVTVIVLINNGLLATHALLLAVVFNSFLALILLAVIRRKSHYLRFPASLHPLKRQVRKNPESHD